MCPHCVQRVTTLGVGIVSKLYCSCITTCSVVISIFSIAFLVYVRQTPTLLHSVQILRFTSLFPNLSLCQMMALNVMGFMNWWATLSSHNEATNIRCLLMKVQRRCFRFTCFFIFLLCTVPLSTWHANCKWRNDASGERTSKQSNVCHKRPSHNFFQLVVASKQVQLLVKHYDEYYFLLLQLKAVFLKLVYFHLDEHFQVNRLLIKYWR